MNPTTPSGTRTFAISIPFGRRQPRTVSPTGSGSAATWRIPATMLSTRVSVSVRRSRKARGWPCPRARSRSARFASRTAGAFSSSPRAMARRASPFTRALASAKLRAASRAARARVSTSSRTSIAATALEYHGV